MIAILNQNGMQVSGKASNLQKLTIATLGRVDVIHTQQLVRIEAQSNYSKLYLADGSTLLVARVLKKFEAQLDNQLFIRTHKNPFGQPQFHLFLSGRTSKNSCA